MNVISQSESALRKPPPRHVARAVLLSTVIDDAGAFKVVNKQRTTGASTVLFELEVGVPLAKKDVAREIVARCLADEYPGQLRGVRINTLDSPYWEADLEAVVPSRPDLILLPKIHSPEEVHTFASKIADLEAAAGIAKGDIRIWSMIETARAVLHAEEIALADPRVDLLLFGPGDYTGDLGTFWSAGDPRWGADAGIECFYARSHMLSAARAAGRLAVDMCFPDVKNLEPMPAHARLSRQMGFDGMLALSPAQLPAIVGGFTPSDEEVAEANKIVSSYEQALQDGQGIVAVDGLHVSDTVASAYRFVLDRAGF